MGPGHRPQEGKADARGRPPFGGNTAEEEPKKEAEKKQLVSEEDSLDNKSRRAWGEGGSRRKERSSL